MNFGKILRRLLLACLIGFVGFIAWVMLWPRPKPVEGWERPPWLPTAASEVHYQSQEGFGWWRVAKFTITERDLRAYAAGRGWKLQERMDYPLAWMRSFSPGKEAPSGRILKEKGIPNPPLSFLRFHGRWFQKISKQTAVAFGSRSIRRLPGLITRRAIGESRRVTAPGTGAWTI